MVRKKVQDKELLQSELADSARLTESASIKTVLENQYSELVIKVSTRPDEKNKRDLMSILTTAREFQGYSVHGDEVQAQRFLDEYIGSGMMPKILKEYPNTTDISYNGRFLTVATNDTKFVYARRGEAWDGMANVRKPDGSPLEIITDDYIESLVTRFANRLNKQFNEKNPQFNGFVDNFRISATHNSLTPVGVGHGHTLSLRISRPSKALNHENFNKFAPNSLLRLLHSFVQAHNNIIISGETGTGKTELLKLLLEPVPFRDKIIMIEDVAETHLPELYPDKDIYDWLTSLPEGHDKDGGVSIEDHVKNALRNQPNWLLVSETRGGEAADMFDSVLSGHNIITTLHAISNEAVPDRFVGMVLQSESGANRPMTDLKNSFYRYMGFGVHIRRKNFENGKILRYLQELVHYDFDVLTNPKYFGVYPIFRQEIEERSDGVYRMFTRWPLQEKVKNQVRLANNLTKDEMYDLWIPTIKMDEAGNLLKDDETDSFILERKEEKIEM